MGVFSFRHQRRTRRRAPKFHDLRHDEEKVIAFASYRNLDELNHEKAHQRSKTEARLDNAKGPFERVLLKRVSLSSLFPPSLSHPYSQHLTLS
jgi:hypothetical protein